MALVNRPDFSIKWAEAGNVLEPATEKRELGHVVEKPPYEIVNWIENNQDNGIAYLMQEGISDWSLDQDYSATSYVKYDGIVYRAKVASIGKQPDIETAVWEIAFVDYSDYTDLNQDLYDTKNTAGHAANLVYKNAPVMTARADGTSYKADTGLPSSNNLNSGYVFDTKENDGLAHNGENPVIVKDGLEVVSFKPLTSILENSNAQATTQWVQQLVESISKRLIPVGSIFSQAHLTVSDDYLELNGQLVSRAAYPDLFAIYGTKYGAGDGSTTFGLPNFKGRFPKGIDQYSEIGVIQESSLPNIKGTVLGSVEESGSSASGAFSLNQLLTSGSGVGAGSWGFDFDASKYNPVYSDTATKVTPPNIGVVYVVKAKY